MNQFTLTKKILMLISVMLCSSCLTPFHVGQDAEPLPKHSMDVSGEIGTFRLNGGVRYGFLDWLDAGVYYGVVGVGRQKLPMISADAKVKIVGAPEKHFMISTGGGFGSGMEYLFPWNETAPHYTEEDVWRNYGCSSLDGYLPLYFSGYLFTDSHSSVSLTYNPHLIYRIGFYDFFHTGSYYSGYSDTALYRNIGKLLIGNAFSIAYKTPKINWYFVINFQKYLNTERDLTMGLDLYMEFFFGVAYKFNLSKRNSSVNK